MKKLVSKIAVLVFGAALMAGCSSTGEQETSYVSDSFETVKITWQDFDKYRDIRSGQESRKGFRERVFNTMNKHFNELMGNLPQGYKLDMVVTNVDLAGDTIMTTNQIRVIKEPYYPSFDFSYKLMDNTGKVVAEATDVNVKDMNFLQSVTLKYRRDFLGHEKFMFDKWFKDTFGEFYEAK
ncbi:DUF3016 domain-containing protein [Thalassotalea agarivorans]|uniref:DUF3016 domain-containing protein n=1 Tax=Thalassotalea agarivorans TaxID=349064 RepID=A0A1I0GL45_THASX|nr:DUF3016 domain-containing protein [Thalassotalea agarivorans]SET71773.1 Protein of unknown function [Thalassotalea agarivorans]